MLGALGLLGVSLIFNIIALTRIGDLQDGIRGLRESTGQRASGLSHDLRRIEERLDDLEGAQRWVSDVEWTLDTENIDGNCADELPMTASWTFQEMQTGADIYLELRSGDSGDWTRVEPEPLGEMEYRATTELTVRSDWNYRIVAESDGSIRVDGPHQVDDLSPWTSRSLALQRGESNNFDGEIWARYAVYSKSERRTHCNEIVDATIYVYEDGEQVESLPMEPEYPGQYAPESVSGSSADTYKEGVVSAGVLPAGSEHEAWWADWVYIRNGYDIEVLVEFADGTERTQSLQVNMVSTR
jgi:hypothetical protein